MKKLKKIILTINAILATVLFVGGVCALDSATWLPAIVCALSLVYLTLFAYANNFFGGVK